MTTCALLIDIYLDTAIWLQQFDLGAVLNSRRTQGQEKIIERLCFEKKKKKTRVKSLVPNVRKLRAKGQSQREIHTEWWSFVSITA
jgi:hypothetical protein